MSRSEHISTRMARLAAVALVLLAVLASATSWARQGPTYKTLVNPDLRHLLVIHSLGQGSASVEGLRQGIDMVLEQSGADVLVRAEHMDLGRATDERYEQLFEEIMRIKYAGAHFDAVITSGLPALRLAARLRAELFPDTVIMAAGVDPTAPLPADLEGIHLITEHLKHADTMLLALRQNPGARHIVVVNNPAPGAPRQSAPLSEMLQSLAADYQVDVFQDMAPQAIESRLSELGRDDVVYLADYVRIGETGLDMSYEDVRRMAYSCRAPMYVSRAFLLGSGVVGGAVSSWREQGRRAMWMTRDLWAGRYVRKRFDEVDRTALPVLDNRALVRFGLSADAAPQATIINQPRKRFDDYRKYFDIYVVGGVFAVLILLMLLIHLRRQAAFRRRMAARRGKNDAA